MEVNAVAGYEPRPSVLSLLRSRVASIVDKPRGIEILPVRTFESSQGSYSLRDIDRLERARRTRYSDASSGEVVIHLLYLNGRIREAESALGLAYRASSIAILPDRIEVASNPVVGAEKIEQAVVVHEAGHLIGLVNIGYSSPRPHEDPDHEGHSSNRGSVMYWAVESLDVANVLAGGPPTQFDSDDRADLADRKSGRI